MEAVKLKALPESDPVEYLWKVVHSTNAQKVGYATLHGDEVAFVDLRGQEVLRVAHTELPGLAVPKARQAALERIQNQATGRAVKRDVVQELGELYKVDSVSMKAARDAEFESRVMSQAGLQVGWCSKASDRAVFFDMNGKELTSIPTSLLSVLSASPAAEPNTSVAIAVRALFKTQSVVTLRREGPKCQFQYKVSGTGTVDRSHCVRL